MSKDTEFDRDIGKLPRSIIRGKVCVWVGEQKVPLRSFLESLPSGAEITFPDTPGIREKMGKGPVKFRKKL